MQKKTTKHIQNIHYGIVSYLRVDTADFPRIFKHIKHVVLESIKSLVSTLKQENSSFSVVKSRDRLNANGRSFSQYRNFFLR